MLFGLINTNIINGIEFVHLNALQWLKTKWKCKILKILLFNHVDVTWLLFIFISKQGYQMTKKIEVGLFKTNFYGCLSTYLWYHVWTHYLICTNQVIMISRSSQAWMMVTYLHIPSHILVYINVQLPSTLTHRSQQILSPILNTFPRLDAQKERRKDPDNNDLASWIKIWNKYWLCDICEEWAQQYFTIQLPIHEEYWTHWLLVKHEMCIMLPWCGKPKRSHICRNDVFEYSSLKYK